MLARGTVLALLLLCHPHCSSVRNREEVHGNSDDGNSDESDDDDERGFTLQGRGGGGGGHGC